VRCPKINMDHTHKLELRDKQSVNNKKILAEI